MGMKNAFEIYFRKQHEFWQSRYSSFPKTPDYKAIDARMIIPNVTANRVWNENKHFGCYCSKKPVNRGYYGTR